MRYWYAPLERGMKGIFTTDTRDMSGLYVGEITKGQYDTIYKARLEEEQELDEFGLPIDPPVDELGLPI